MAKPAANRHERVIWKYPFDIADEFHLAMPEGAKILALQLDARTGKPAIWAMLKPSNEAESRYFVIRPTGVFFLADEEMETYIGTVQTPGAIDQHGVEISYVWHVFERCIGGFKRG